MKGKWRVWLTCLAAALVVSLSVGTGVALADEEPQAMPAYAYADAASGEQGPIWHYMYFNNASPDYLDLTYDGSNWGVPSDDSFYAGNTEYMKISPEHGWMSTSYTYDSVLAFKAPHTGYVDVSGTLSIGEQGNGVTLYVIKQNAADSVEKWLSRQDYADASEQLDLKHIPVTQGDWLYFRAACNNSDISFDTLFLSPVVTYTALATQELPWSIFDSAFSATQGDGGWYYKAFENATGKYVEMDFPNTAGQSNRFDVEFYGNNKPQWGMSSGGDYMNIWNGEWVSTTWSYDTVIAYKAPLGGTVDVDMDWFVWANEGANGVDFKLLRSSGGVTLPANLALTGSSDWLTMGQGAEGKVAATDVELRKGDWLYFRVNAHESNISFDKLFLNPVIRYTAISEDQSEVTEIKIETNRSLMLKAGSTVQLDWTVSPQTVEHDSIEIVSSDEAVIAIADGRAEAKSKGTATLTFTEPQTGTQTTCNVIVTAAVYQAVAEIGTLGALDEQGPVWYRYYAVREESGMRYGEMVCTPSEVNDTSEAGPITKGYKWSIDPQSPDFKDNEVCVVFSTEFLHPGHKADAVLAYRSEVKGVVDLYDVVRAVDVRSNGVGIRIFQNDRQIFPEEGSYVHAGENAAAVMVKDVAVEQGDMLYFHVDDNGQNNFDVCCFNPTVAYVSIEQAELAVTVESGTLRIETEETAMLKAQVTPLVLGDREITFTSADPEIAKVSYSGIVTGLKVGTTTVTVSVEGGRSATVTVEVVEPQLPPPTEPSGGCGCNGCGGAVAGHSLWWGLLLLPAAIVLFIKRKPKNAK